MPSRQASRFKYAARSVGAGKLSDSIVNRLRARVITKGGIAVNIRIFVGLFLILIWAAVSPAGAQPSGKVWKIGVLVSSSQALNAAREETKDCARGCAEQGYEEGKNIVLEYRFAEGKVDRLPQLARELVDQHPGTPSLSPAALRWRWPPRKPPTLFPSWLPAPAVLMLKPA